MLPDQRFVTINSSVSQIEKFIDEVILTPRLKSIQWSKITKQTPGLKIGYPAQHIASLITGVEGKRSAARGDDLADGSEVKGCNRIDQLDTCKNCAGKVLRHEINCSACNSSSVDRKDDSKWLISIRSESELKLYTEKIDRLIFILFDYPSFNDGNFDKLSITAYEIWPKGNEPFKQLMEDYFYKIYQEHTEKDRNKTPAPKNIWPYSFQFYKCNPIKIFECVVDDINTIPKINTNLYVSPSVDRSNLTPESMPTYLLKPEEVDLVIQANFNELIESNEELVRYWNGLTDKQKTIKINKQKLYDLLPSLPYNLIDCLELRDTSRAIPHSTKYIR